MFYKNYIVYYNVYCVIVVCSLKSMCTPSFVLIGCCVSELHGHICPYHNVWPEAVYWFYKNYIVYHIVYIYVGYLLFYKNYIVSYNVYCVIVVCSLKSMCTPSFVLIGCCVTWPLMSLS